MDYLRHLIGSNYEDPDVKRTVRELVESRGFKLENHHVTTDDGYILTLHRLVNPHHNHNNVRPLLLQHGFGSCSVHWMVNSADGHAVPCADSPDSVNDNVSNNTAFALSNGGFDVWLGNFRGNHYSAKHKRLTTDDLSYWDFSIDELVQYDLPAMIDHIIETTGQPSIRYIGFSQGTTAMFGLLSEKPEYNAKLKPYIAMAPIISYYNSTSLIGWLPRVLAAIHGEHGVAMPTGLNRLMSTGRLMGSFLARPWQIFNHHVLGLGFGFNYDQIDWERLPVVASRPFGDLSYKSFRHHTQLRESGPAIF
ncbi:Lipase member M [Halotydeus destructor]|nr:Lipase member M [Halotydeus destructor]